MMKMNTATALATCLCIAYLPSLEAAEIPGEVKDIVRERVADGKTMSIVIGLIDPTGATYFSEGKMAASGEEKPDEATVYEIGSITKVFTAILLADAVKRGEVNYDDPISTHLPEGIVTPKTNGKSITLEHLSVQTSGLPRMPSNFKPKNYLNPFADYTVKALYEYLGTVELRREVGEKYAYSNTGVGLLGHLLEQAAGVSYEELVVTRIAEVVGMTDTAIALSEDMQARLAKGHLGKKEVPNWDLPTLAGAGALRSTAQDMIAFLEANMGTRETPLLESMKETHQSRAEVQSGKMEIGLGWHIRIGQDARKTYWHNGGTGGYRTFAGFTNDPPMGVVVLTNSTGAGDDDIGFHLLDSAFPMAGAVKRAKVELEPEVLERYVGKYQLNPKTVFDIVLQDDQLRAQLTGQPRVPIFPESETKFFYKIVDAQLSFELDGNGVVKGLILHQGGLNQKAKKVE